MTGYLRSLRIAVRIELVLAAVWTVLTVFVVIGFALAAVGAPAHARQDAATTVGIIALTALVPAALFVGPAIAASWVFARQQRSRSPALTGVILAFLVALLYVAGVVFMALQGGQDILGPPGQFVVGVTAAPHVAAGVTVLWGRRGLSAGEGPHELSPSDTSGHASA